MRADAVERSLIVAVMAVLAAAVWGVLGPAIGPLLTATDGLGAIAVQVDDTARADPVTVNLVNVGIDGLDASAQALADEDH